MRSEQSSAWSEGCRGRRGDGGRRYNAARPDAHKAVTQNFVNAILKDEPLICPGEEGVRGLEIGNAMLMAGVTRKAVDLPMDAGAFDDLLKDLEKQYGGRKTIETPKDAVVDMGASFAKN